MDLERAAIMGRLAEAQQNRDKLILLIEGYCQNLRSGLNTVLTPAADLEIPRLGVQWDALEGAWADLQAINAEVDRLQRGLR